MGYNYKVKDPQKYWDNAIKRHELTSDRARGKHLENRQQEYWWCLRFSVTMYMCNMCVWKVTLFKQLESKSSKHSWHFGSNEGKRVWVGYGVRFIAYLQPATTNQLHTATLVWDCVSAKVAVKLYSNRVVIDLRPVKRISEPAWPSSCCLKQNRNFSDNLESDFWLLRAMVLEWQDDRILGHFECRISNRF